MTKQKTQENQIVSAGDATTMPVSIPTEEKISEEDRVALELARSKRETSIAQAKEFLSKSEFADLVYKHMVLQIYYKYQLNQKDQLDETTGKIIRNKN